MRGAVVGFFFSDQGFEMDFLWSYLPVFRLFDDCYLFLAAWPCLTSALWCVVRWAVVSAEGCTVRVLSQADAEKEVGSAEHGEPNMQSQQTNREEGFSDVEMTWTVFCKLLWSSGEMDVIQLWVFLTPDVRCNLFLLSQESEHLLKLSVAQLHKIHRYTQSYTHQDEQD